jgi:hypothetical protein
MAITVSDPQAGTYWLVYPSLSTIQKYDNGVLISIGWTVGKDLPRRVFARLTKKQMTSEQYAHSGCQSACITRGHQTCRW